MFLSGRPDYPMRMALLAVHAGFVLTGIVTTLLGPLIPTLEARWSLNDAMAGRLFAAQFLGSLVGALASGRMMARFGPLSGVVAGYLTMSAGLTGVGATRWTAGLAAVACYGLGLGVTIPATNLLVSEWCRETRAAALNLVNFAWGVGAVAAPPIIAATLRTSGLRPLLAGIGGLLAANAALALLAGRHAKSVLSVAERISPGEAGARSRTNSLVWLTGALLFLYVGVENGIAGWLPSLALRAHGLSEPVIAALQASFWGALLAGRLLAPLVLRRVPADLLVLLGLYAASSGAAAVLLATNGSALFAGALLAGGGMAAVFPTVVALFTERAGIEASRHAGIVFALAALGGATIPWAMGNVSAHLDSLRTAMLIPLVCLPVMIVLQLRLRAMRSR